MKKTSKEESREKGGGLAENWVEKKVKIIVEKKAENEIENEVQRGSAAVVLLTLRMR